MSNLLEAALERYARTEPEIRAWVEVNPQPALADGPLQGAPFGVKDIFETTALATEYGSPLYAGRKGDCDASLVTLLRKQGAILFGKTCTTAFAYFDPALTRNPRNLAHTPGGSSSGSAAAVAAGVVPFALGSQTMGSIVRPASFCGVVGFKPTFGILPRDGVLPFAPSLDTVGFLVESAELCMRIWQVLAPLGGKSEIRFGVLQGLPPVSPEMQTAFEQVTGAFDKVSMSLSYMSLLAEAKTINDYEGARSHYERWTRFGSGVGEKLAQLVERGMKISGTEYEACLQRLNESGKAMEGVFDKFSVLLTPAAAGTAPEGLGSTGDPVMNAVWTALGVPVITIPMPRPVGMPLGLQLMARRNADGMLLRAAVELERLLAR